MATAKGLKSAGSKEYHEETDDYLKLDASVLRQEEVHIFELKKTVTAKPNAAIEKLELTIYDTNDSVSFSRRAIGIRHARFRLTTDFPLPPPKPNSGSVLLNAVALRQSSEYHRKLEAEIDKINVNFYKNFLKRKQYERVIAKFQARAKNLMFLAGGAAVVYGSVSIAGPYVIQYLLQHNLLAPGSRFVTMFKASLELFFNIPPQKMKALDTALKTMQTATRDALGTVGQMGIAEDNLFTKAFGILADGKNNPFTGPVSDAGLAAATKFSSGGKTYTNTALANYQEAVIGLFNTVLDVISPSPLFSHFLEQTGMNSKIRPVADKTTPTETSTNPWFDFSSLARTAKLAAIKAILKVDDARAEELLTSFETWSNTSERLKYANTLYKNYSMDISNIYGLFFDEAYANPKFQVNYVNKMANRLSQNRTLRGAFSNGFSSWVGEPTTAPTREDGLMKPVLLFWDSITPHNFMGCMGGMVYDELTQTLSSGLQSLSSSVFAPKASDMADDDDDARAKKALAMEEYREIIKKTTVLRLRQGRNMTSVMSEIEVLSKVMHPDYKFDGNDVALLDNIWYSFGKKTNELLKSGRIKAALTWTGATTLGTLVGEVARYDSGNPFNNTKGDFGDVFSFYSEPFYEVTRDFMTTWTSGEIRGLLQEYRDLFTKLYDETYEAYIRKPLLAMGFMKEMAKWQKNAKAWVAFKQRWFLSIYINMCLEKVIDFTFGILRRTITETPYQGLTQIDYMMGPENGVSFSMNRFPMLLTNEYVSWIFEGITQQNIYGLYGRMAKAYNGLLNPSEMRTLSAGVDIAQGAIQQGGTNIYNGLLTSLKREARTAGEAFPGVDEAALFAWLVNIMSSPSDADADADVRAELEAEPAATAATAETPPPIQNWSDWAKAQAQRERQRIADAYKVVTGMPAAAAEAIRAAARAARDKAAEEIAKLLIRSQRELLYSMIPHGKRYTQDTYWFHLPNGGKIRLNEADTAEFEIILNNSNFIAYIAEQFILSGEKKPCDADFLNAVAPGLARNIANYSPKNSADAAALRTAKSADPQSTTSLSVAAMCKDIDGLYNSLAAEQERLTAENPETASAKFREFLSTRRQADLRDLMAPYFMSYQIGGDAYEGSFLDATLRGVFQQDTSYINIDGIVYKVSKATAGIPATGDLAVAGYNFVPLSRDEISALPSGTKLNGGIHVSRDAFVNAFYAGIYSRAYIPANVVPSSNQWIEAVNANFVFGNPKFFFYNSLSSAADLYYQRYVISGMMILGLSATDDDDSDENKARRSYLERVEAAAKTNPLIARNLYELTIIWENIPAEQAKLDAILEGLSLEEQMALAEQEMKFYDKTNPSFILDDRISAHVIKLGELNDRRDVLINDIIHNLPDVGTFRNLRSGHLEGIKSDLKEESRKATELLNALPDDDDIGVTMDSSVLAGIITKVSALPDTHPDKARFTEMLLVFARGPISLLDLQRLREELTEFVDRIDRLVARVEAQKTSFGDTTAFHEELRSIKIHGADFGLRIGTLSIHHNAWTTINGTSNTVNGENVNVIAIETAWSTYMRETAAHIFNADNSSITTNSATFRARFAALPGLTGADFTGRRAATFERLMAAYNTLSSAVVKLPQPSDPNYNTLLQERYDEIIARSGSIANARIAIELFLLQESGPDGQAAYAAFLNTMYFTPTTDTAVPGGGRKLKDTKTPPRVLNMATTTFHINARQAALSERMNMILAGAEGLRLDARQLTILDYYSRATGAGPFIRKDTPIGAARLTDEQLAVLNEYGEGMDALNEVNAYTDTAGYLALQRSLYMAGSDAIASRIQALEYAQLTGIANQEAFDELVALYTGVAPAGTNIKFVYRRIAGTSEDQPDRYEVVRITTTNPLQKDTDLLYIGLDTKLQTSITSYLGQRVGFEQSRAQAYKDGRVKTFDETTVAFKKEFSSIISTVTAEMDNIQLLIDNFALTGGSPDSEYLVELRRRHTILKNIHALYHNIEREHGRHRAALNGAVLDWAAGLVLLPADPTFHILVARLRGLFDITNPAIRDALKTSLATTIRALGDSGSVDIYLEENGTGIWDVLLSKYSGDEAKLAIIRAAKTSWFATRPLSPTPILHDGGETYKTAKRTSEANIYTALAAERVAAEIEVGNLRGLIPRLKLDVPPDDDDDKDEELNELRLYFSLNSNTEADGHFKRVDTIIDGILQAPVVPNLERPETSAEILQGIINELAHLQQLNAYLQGTSINTLALQWQGSLNDIRDILGDLRELKARLEAGSPAVILQGVGGEISGTGVPGAPPEPLNPAVLLKNWDTFLKGKITVPSPTMQARYVTLGGELAVLQTQYNALLTAMASRSPGAAARGASPEAIAAFRQAMTDFQTKFNALSNVSGLRAGGETASSLKNAGFSATALYVPGGYTVTELIDAGYDSRELQAAKVPANLIKTANEGKRPDKKTISLTDMIIGGYSVPQLMTAGYTAKELVDADTRAPDKKITAAQLKAAGYTAKNLFDAGFTALQLVEADTTSTKFTAAQLKAAGYTATQLKAANFTAKELVTANFKLADLSVRKTGAGYNATELKDAGFSVSALKGEGYNISVISAAGFSIPELLAGGFTKKEVATIKSVADLKAAGWTPAQLKDAGFNASQLKGDGPVPHFTAAELVRAKGVNLFTATELKIAGYTAADLFAAGFTANQLVEAANNDKRPGVIGYSVNELYTAGYTVESIKAAPWKIQPTVSDWAIEKNKGADGIFTYKYLVPLAKLIEGGYSITQLRSGGFNPGLLNTAAARLGRPNYTEKDLKIGGYSASELYNHGYTDLAKLRVAGYTAKDLKDTGLPSHAINASKLKDAGYGVGNLLNAAYTASDLLTGVPVPTTGRFTIAELRTGGYKAADMKGVVTLAELKKAGYTATDFKTGNFGAAELKAAGFTATDLKIGGFSAGDLNAGGFSAGELKTAKFTAADLKTGGFTAADLKTAEFSAADLKTGGFTATDLKTAGFTASELKIGGFSAADLKTSGFNASDLNAGGFSGSDLKTAGFTAGDLKIAGLSLSDLVRAGFSADDLKGVPFTADVLIVYFTPVELAGAGFREDEITRAYTNKKAAARAERLNDVEAAVTIIEGQELKKYGNLASAARRERDEAQAFYDDMYVGWGGPAMKENYHQKLAVYDPLKAAQVIAQQEYDAAKLDEGLKDGVYRAAQLDADLTAGALTWEGRGIFGSSPEYIAAVAARDKAAKAKTDLEAAEAVSLNKLGNLTTANSNLSGPQAELIAANAAMAQFTIEISEYATRLDKANARAKDANADFVRRQRIAAAEQRKIDAALEAADAEELEAQEVARRTKKAADAANSSAAEKLAAALAAAEAQAAKDAAASLHKEAKDAEAVEDPAITLTPREQAELQARLVALKAAIEKRKASQKGAVDAIKGAQAQAQALGQGLALSQTQTQILAQNQAQTEALASAEALEAALKTGLTIGLTNEQHNALDKLEEEYLDIPDEADVHAYKVMYSIAQETAATFFKRREKKPVAGKYYKDAYDFGVLKAVLGRTKDSNPNISADEFEEFLHREFIIDELFADYAQVNDINHANYKDIRVALHKCLMQGAACTDFSTGLPAPIQAEFQGMEGFKTPKERTGFWERALTDYASGKPQIPTHHSINAKYITDAIFVEGYSLPLESVGGQHAQDVGSRIEVFVSQKPRRSKIGMLHGAGDAATRIGAKGVRLTGTIIRDIGKFARWAVAEAVLSHPYAAAIAAAGGAALYLEWALQQQISTLQDTYRAHQPIKAWGGDPGQPPLMIDYGDPFYDIEYNKQMAMNRLTQAVLAPAAIVGAAIAVGVSFPTIGEFIRTREEQYIRDLWTDSVGREFNISRADARLALKEVRGQFGNYLWNWRVNLWSDFLPHNDPKQQGLFQHITETSAGAQADLRKRFKALFDGTYNERQIPENLKKYKTHILEAEGAVCSQNRKGDDDFWLDCRFKLFPEELQQLLSLLTSPLLKPEKTGASGGAYETNPFRNVIFALWLAKIHWYAYGVSEKYIFECMTREYTHLLRTFTFKMFLVLESEGPEAMAALNLDYAIPCITRIHIDLVFPIKTAPTDSRIARPASAPKGGSRKSRSTQKQLLRLRGTMKH